LAHALIGAIPNANALHQRGLFEAAVTLAANSPPPMKNVEHWRLAPFGKRGRGVKANQRKAAKRRAVVRARKLGHA